MIYRLVLVLLCALIGCSRAEPRDEVRIGAIASLSGVAADQGKQWFDGALLATREFKEAGIPVRLMVEDDRSSVTRLEAAFKQLVEGERSHAIIGGTWESTAEAVAALASRYKVPFVSPTTPAELFADARTDNHYAFSSAMSFRVATEALRNFLVSKKLRRVVVAYPQRGFGREYAAFFDRLLEEGVLSGISKHELPISGVIDDSLKLVALDAQRAGADCVFAALDYRGVETVARELRTLGIAPVVVTTTHLEQAFNFSQTRGDFANAFAVYPKVDLTKEFKALHARIIRRPIKNYTAEGYDTVKFLVLALRAGIVISDPKSVFEYKGITGTFRLPAVDRNISDASALIMTTESGKFEPWVGQVEERLSRR